MYKKLCAGFFLALFIVGAVASPALARWIRAASAPTRIVDDISVCADEITLKSILEYPPDFLSPEDIATGSFTEQVRLWASAEDAESLDSATAVMVFDFNTTFARTLDNGFVEFEDTATLPTPAGFDNGDFLYGARGQAGGSPTAVPLEIGGVDILTGEPYECDSPSEPIELNMNVWTVKSKIWVNSWFPYVVAFDNNQVDRSTLQIQANNGTNTSVNYIGSWSHRGFGYFYPNSAGVTCDSTSLVLTATSTSGEPMRSEYNINPVGWACW